MNIRSFLIIMMTLLPLAASTAQAKVIALAEKGDNKIFIRTDGLACYFCAYGMERFFKKSGRIAWYDMNMKDGVVEVGFIKGKPILDIKTLKQYVHDAGFTPREMKAEFVGRLVPNPEGSYRFEVAETAQSLPVEVNAVVRKSEEALQEEVTLIARVEEDPAALMRLVPERIGPKRSER